MITTGYYLFPKEFNFPNILLICKSLSIVLKPSPVLVLSSAVSQYFLPDGWV